MMTSILSTGRSVVFSLVLLALSFSLEAGVRTEVIAWDSKESIERLSRSKEKLDFFPLSNHFVSQDNNIVCGPATVAIVLNALRLRKSDNLPVDESSIQPSERGNFSPGYSPFMQKYTQLNVIDESVKTRAAVFGEPVKIAGEKKKDFGFQLHQLAQLFEAHGTQVKKQVVHDELDSKQVVAEIRSALRRPGQYVVINYHRQALGQSPGAGHISPIGAYDESSDSFLIMDVNPFRQPWVWVNSEALVAAMRTFDTIANRGYLIVSDN